MAVSELDAWLQNMAKYLVISWGLDTAFASQVALLYLYFYYYGLNPSITSGFRDPQKQNELMQRWLNGDPSIVVKPTTNSKHSATKLGKPASLAVDISTANHLLAAQIATALKVGAGYYYKIPDPVHFYI